MVIQRHTIVEFFMLLLFLYFLCNKFESVFSSKFIIVYSLKSLEVIFLQTPHNNFGVWYHVWYQAQSMQNIYFVWSLNILLNRDINLLISLYGYQMFLDIIFLWVYFNVYFIRLVFFSALVVCRKIDAISVHVIDSKIFYYFPTTKAHDTRRISFII